MKNPSKECYRIHSEICKTIAHAKRLEILDTLRKGELSVNELAHRMGVQAANVSQQLALLRSAGVVETRRTGTTVHYRIANPKILKAYDLMTEVMEEAMTARSRLARGSRPRTSSAPRLRAPLTADRRSSRRN